MRKVAIGLVCALASSAGVCAAAETAAVHKPPSRLSLRGYGATTGAAPIQNPAPPVAIVKPVSPNGLYSLSPPGASSCNTNVAVVQQSGCVH